MNLSAKTLLRSLICAWPKLSRSGASHISPNKLPPDLRILAEKTKVREELLEHLSTDVLYYNK